MEVDAIVLDSESEFSVSLAPNHLKLTNDVPQSPVAAAEAIKPAVTIIPSQSAIHETNASQTQPNEPAPTTSTAHDTFSQEQLRMDATGLTSQPSAGSEVPIASFFQISAKGKDIVYVIDRSGSMGQNGSLEAAKKELLASLEKLPFSARFQIIVYNRTPLPLSINGNSGLVPVTRENKMAVARRLKELFAEGGTEHRAAIAMALRSQPDAIFLLTDGAELKPEQIRSLTALNGGRSTIHAVELRTSAQARADVPLQSLARQNRGAYRSLVLER
jgi:hypothetical protein